MDDYTNVERYDTDISSIKEEDTGIYHVADNKYLIIRVKLGNKSSEQKYFSTNDFKILYNGQTYKNLVLESILYGESHHYDGLGWGWSVDPQKWKTVFLVFDVPEDIDTAQYIYYHSNRRIRK